MRKFGLIGYPLGHSFSKRYFTEKFKKENIRDTFYENFPIEDVSDFESLYKNDPQIQGLNVTIPYKESIIKYLDVLSEDARGVQAVNTICLCRKTGRLAKVGHNTDVTGFRKSLEDHLMHLPEQALVLGTGGSSRAVVFVLKELGIPVIRVSHSGKENTIAYSEIDDVMVDASRLIVNTTPLGMYPEIDRSPDIPYTALTEHHLLFDLVYNPEVTRFMQLGKERGASVVNGYDMLVYQAEASWEIWNRK
jgi:shikimate dehydrogenase